MSENEEDLASAMEHADGRPAALSGGESENLVRDLFDMRFRKVILTRMLPVVYSVFVMVAVAVCAYFTVQSFRASELRGFIWLLVVDPIAFIGSLVAARVIVEVIVAVATLHLSLRRVDELIIPSVHDLSGTVGSLSRTLENMTEVVENASHIRDLMDKVLTCMDAVVDNTKAMGQTTTKLADTTSEMAEHMSEIVRIREDVRRIVANTGDINEQTRGLPTLPWKG